METEKNENKIINQTKKRKPKNMLVAILGILFLAASLAAGLLLVRQNQQIREKAATPSGTVRLFLSPETKTVDVGQTFSVNILLDTAGRSISALTIDLSYPYNDEQPPLVVTDIQINSNLVVNGNWNFPIKSANAENQLVQIRIGGLNSSSDGYKTSGEENIATINFKAQTEGDVTLTFNPTTTKATDKTTGEDILLTPSSVGSYFVDAGEENPTKTPTPTATTIPTPSPTTNTGVTPKASPRTSTTPILAATPTSSPIPAPESGISLPTAFGVGSGILLLIGAFMLVF